MPAALWGATARAQAPADTGARAISLDSVAATLKAGQWNYSSRLHADGRSQSFGRRTIAIVPTVHDSVDAWLLVDEQRGPSGTAIDSLLVARRDLASLRRSMRLSGSMGEVAISMRFTPDSVRGEVHAGGRTEALTMANVGGVVASDAAVLAVLSTVRLHPTWTGTLGVINPSTRSAVPVALRVIGSEPVRVPAGSFVTWVVEARAGGTTATYYVPRGGPVVLIVAPFPQRPGATVETVLERRPRG